MFRKSAGVIGSEVPVCVFTWSKTWDFLQNVTDHVRWDCVVLGIQSSAWPDLVIGLGIFALNLDASRQVYGAARDEHRAALAEL